MGNPPAYASVENAYNTVAESYAELLPDARYEAALDLAVLEEFAQRMSSTTNRSVLDAGCGAGRMAAILERFDLNLSGIDLSAEMIRIARRSFPSQQYQVGNLNDLPYPDRSFDGVLSWYSIIHTPAEGLAAMMQEFRRVLRPGGSLLLGFKVGQGQRAITHAYGHDVSYCVQLHTLDSVRKALLASGFSLDVEVFRAARNIDKEAQGFMIATLPTA
ncbi:ubiquinone/menaquinone biosynthesis C-methylase UbiE [Psychromicrobium silvestre]|uniref:Ubiquinone/menaquinone biosynthesis C-methylase UbiE n=1 Tax=Psychromicrobium silvestre TaxID=1645614 RepID=A0A7Y9LSG2_9MICC|nr:class I SAM-dependent methyltransferase [Psychromicrobium silvestre]NYE94748.1 ubiquinone/menaquinone biosynthesis C-methylase UbiE [Psychromicrobium silvestre]